MDEEIKKKKHARLRRKWVNMMKHKHPNSNFKQLWAEAYEKYP